MTRQVEMTPDLATLLERHREEIATAWAVMASQLPDSRYRERPLEELRASTMRSLGAIIEALTTGSYAALEAYLTDVSLSRVRMGFDISEVLEAMLLLKDATQPFILRVTASSSAAAQEPITQLDACLRWIVGCLGELYAAEMSRHLREQQNRTALLLEMAQAASSSLDLDEVLRRVARGIATAAGVRHCGFYLMDEEQGLLIPRLGTDALPTPTATQAFLNRPLDLTSADPFVRQVLDRKEPLTSYDAQTDPRMDKEAARLLGVKSTLAVPFVAKDRILAVAIVGTFDDYHTFTEEQIELAWGIASNSRFGVVSPIRTAHKPKRGDSVRVDGPREEKTGLRIGILTSLILPNEVSGYSRSGN